jgi:smad nuclear-interacting protein 1
MDRKKKHSHDHDKKPYSKDDFKDLRYPKDKDAFKEPKHDKNKDSDNYKHYKYGKGDDANFKDSKYGKDKGKSKDSKYNSKDEITEENKEQPNLGLSGNLAKDTNLFNGVVIKYNEPSEARKPKKRWRLYVFKGEEELPFYQIHRQSAYLFSRERKIADIPVEHPSCSKQHAVLQYRSVSYTKDDGTGGRVIRPYVIDLGSTNGTYINNERIEAQRYYELKEKDVVKFGFSSREYVLLHEESKADENTDVDDSSSEDEPIVRPKKEEEEQPEKSDDDDDD